MLNYLKIVALAIVTVGISLLVRIVRQNTELKRENRQLEAERDKAKHEAKVAEVKAQRAGQRLKEQVQINEKFDSVEIGEDIKIGLDE